VSVFSNLVLIQWLYDDASSSGSRTVSLPYAFTTTYCASRTHDDYTTSDTGASIRATYMEKNSLSQIRYYAFKDSPSMFIAIGY